MSSVLYKLEPTPFQNLEGEKRNYYLKGNPWKVSTDNRFQKQFRYCVNCGDKRISNAKWAGILSGMRGSPLVCEKKPCLKALAYVPKFIPRKYRIVETEEDKERAQGPLEKEYFERILGITLNLRPSDKVYKNESEIPPYPIFNKLEEMAVEVRELKIAKAFATHVKTSDVEVGNKISDTKDPFLKALANYREKCYEILERIKNEL